MDVVSSTVERVLTGVGDDMMVGGVRGMEVTIGAEVEGIEVATGVEVGVKGRCVDDTGVGCTVVLHGI